MYASVSGMHCRAVTYLTTVATILLHSAGELIIAPRNTESMVGEITYFNCSTDLDYADIFWYHGNKYIYNGHGILEPYNKRFEIERISSTGSHNLVIHSVEPGDAGAYICSDDEGAGTRRSAKLIVLDNDPDCQSNIQPDGVIGQNIFNIAPDEVQFTCTVTYNGDIHPQLEWKRAGDNFSITGSLTTTVVSTNRLAYTLNLKGDISLDKSSYVCQTKRSAQHQYKCTSQVIKVLYFFEEGTTELNVVRGETITCIKSNNTFPCNSQWYHDNYTCPLSCDETITTHLLGEYLCTAKCHIRGRDYYVDALKAFVADPIADPMLLTQGAFAASVVVPIAIIVTSITATSIAIIIVRNKIRKVKQREFEELDNRAFMSAQNARSEARKQKGTPGEVGRVEDVEIIHKIKEDKKLKEKEIRGIAILHDKLFVVRKNSSRFTVYDFNANDFHKCKFLTVKELVATLDLCSCKTKNCLYIMDEKTNPTPPEVLLINLEDKSVKHWPTKDEAIGNVSAATNGNIIITDHDRQIILEYSNSGDVIHEISLQECTNPWHAIKWDDDTYIISHGDYFDPLHRVCLLKVKVEESVAEPKVEKEVGLIVEKSYGEQRGSAKGQLNMPTYFTSVSNKFVFVADLFNNRVLLLDSHLELQGQIVPKNKQKFLLPQTVALDDKRLVVVIQGMATEGDTLTSKDDCRIEEDCRILIFNIELLLRPRSSLSLEM